MTDHKFENNREIPPITQPKNKFLLVGLGLLAAIAVYFILSSDAKNKEPSLLNKTDEEFTPGEDRSTLAEFGITDTLKKEASALLPTSISNTDNKDAELENARQRSPMVIFNQTQQAPSETKQTDKSSTPNSNANALASRDGNSQFMQNAGQSKVETVAASESRSGDNRINQGKLIDAVLETAVQSDLPGMLRAIVAQDVYAESGRAVLMPKGSRLIGQYNNNIKNGQSRVFVIWQRLILPNGSDIALGSPGTDALGRAGLDGDVDTHFWQRFGTATLLSLIGASAANLGIEGGDQANSMSSYRQALMQAFQENAQESLSQDAKIPPTIHVEQGTRIKVFVAKDVEVLSASADAKEHPNYIAIF